MTRGLLETLGRARRVLVNKPGARTPGRTLRLTAKITGITELLNATGVRSLVGLSCTPGLHQPPGWRLSERGTHKYIFFGGYYKLSKTQREPKSAPGGSAASARGQRARPDGRGVGPRAAVLGAPTHGPRLAPRARRRAGRRRRQLIARVPRVEKGHEFQERLAVIYERPRGDGLVLLLRGHDWL